MPTCDAFRVERRVVEGEIADVYEVVLEADFLDAVRQNAAVRVLFAVRSAGERLVGLVRRSRPSAVAAPPSLRILDMPPRGEWVRLGDNPPEEIVFGAVGQFWAGKTQWETVTAQEWNQFDRPGFAKIACNFVLSDHGGQRTLVTYEARTLALDDSSRRGFRRYWRVVSPFVGVVMRSMLALVGRESAASRGTRDDEDSRA